MLIKQQLQQIENWLTKNARPVEVAKWNLMFGKGTVEDLVSEMIKYQNPDGGFGNGFESDILTPESAAIPSAEAIFTAQDYGLDLTADWAKKLMGWFVNTAADTPSFWEAVPPSLEDYPHPPWWSYHPDTEFTSNPCAVAASVLLLFGTDSQRTLGEEVAKRCVDFILRDENYWDHDTYCLQRLFLVLTEKQSPLITQKVIEAMEQRILKSVCTDSRKWTEYVAQPLDLVNSPDSCWYGLLADDIPGNLDYWERTLTTDGYWPPNFNWGVDTEVSRAAIKNWLGYFAVKRVKILNSFGFCNGDPIAAVCGYRV